LGAAALAIGFGEVDQAVDEMDLKISIFRAARDERRNQSERSCPFGMGSLRWHDSWTGLCLILATSADKTARVAGRETLFLCGYKIPVRSGPAAFGRPWREISGLKF
jgi:hypothetical protein